MPTTPALPQRPATVELDAANRERLQRYPRPPQDNGIGLHFHLDLRDDIVAETVANLKSIGATWTLIYAQDELQAERVATACFKAGIMPVVRIGTLINEPFADPAAYVDALRRALQASGFPYDPARPPLYVQVYNEPEDSREWVGGDRPDNWPEVFGRNWARAALRVFQAGGYPGIQVLDRPGFDAAVDAVNAMGAQEIWERAFFVHHNYGQNHPPAYPYDARNQQDNPGQTILEDHVAALKFLAHAAWMKERLGFVLPQMGGEGGWWPDNDEDKRYPKVNWTLHAEYTREMFEWLSTGRLSNGEPLPDYLFSITPWIAGSFTYGGQNWWGNWLSPDGKLTQTIEAVQAIPTFVRRFSWDQSGTPETEPQPKPEPEPQPQPEPEPQPEPDPEPQPEPDPGVSPLPQPTPLAWDSRLDALGVKVARAAAQGAWRLVAVQYQDESESAGKTNVFIRAEHADGTPAPGVRFVVDWQGRQPDETPGYTTTNAQGQGDVPIFIPMDPARQNGIQFAQAADDPSDVITGMGLPNQQRVSYVLTFRRA